MNFASFPYLCFLLASVLLYFTLGKNLRNFFLLLTSYIFYSFFGFGFVALMIFTTIITFICARYCYKAETKNAQLGFFLTGLLLDLVVFILFKYVHIIDVDIMNWPGWSAQKLLIPVGISFYTFKTVGYCIDVYKRKYEPEPFLLYYALSVSFFPQLIAGPIEKSHNIIGQLKENRNFNAENFIEGGKLILWGFFKKIAIADTLALIINPAYSNIEKFTGLDLIILSIAFIYQVYADFSGYSDIAIGSAKCLGIKLPFNFNKPFFSKNCREFWLRWHATLSIWFKEYIYIPLGGNKKGKMRTFLNLFIIFLISGIWHGITFNYICFAILSFAWVLIDLITEGSRLKLVNKFRSATRWYLLKIMSYVAIIIMFASVCVFFRTETMNDAIYIFRHLFTSGEAKLGIVKYLFIAGTILVLEFMQMFQASGGGHCFELMKNPYTRIFAYVTVLFILLLVSARPDVTFQYFQF
jgi:alginate O-acetyltransferase complex protein AlgI